MRRVKPPGAVRETAAPYRSETPRPIMVDTSVWVDYLRGGGNEREKRVAELMAFRRALMCEVASGELFRGARDEAERTMIVDTVRLLPPVYERPGLWAEAGRMSCRLRRMGHAAGLIDCYIGVLAREQGASLLSRDRDFIHIASELRIPVEIL